MRTPLVAGNWKMHTTVPESAALAQATVAGLSALKGVEVVVCPPFTSLHALQPLLRGTPVALGAQNVFWLEWGAFTGQVSPAMLSALGVSHCIVGHSETRGRFGKLDIAGSCAVVFAETDETVSLKVQALLPHRITPIVCVGETQAEREQGRAEAVVREQLRGAVAGLVEEELGGLCIAYEPVWAIGTGLTCDAAEAGRMATVVRATLADLGSSEGADRVRVLYGGSVKPSNADELFAQPDIDGGLIGGASLEAQGFCRIAFAAMPQRAMESAP